jgi:hypothetical protein
MQAARLAKQVGTAIGSAIYRHNQIKNYCKFHPGEEWHSGDWRYSGTCKVAKLSKSAQKSAQFAYGSPEWCSHQAKGSSYVALDGAHYCPAKSDSSHFTPDSPRAKEWCSHQPNGMSYLGSDDASHNCPAKYTSIASQPSAATASLRPAVTHVDAPTVSTMKWAGEWHVVGTQLQCVYRYKKTDGESVVFSQLYDVGQPWSPSQVSGLKKLPH